MLTTTKGWNPWWGKGGGQDSSKTECSTAWAGGRVGGWVGAWAGHCLISQNDRFCHRFLNQSVSPYMAQVHRYSRWVFCTGCDYAFGLADFFAWGGHDGEPAACEPAAGNQGLWWEPSKFQNCLLHISQTLHTTYYIFLKHHFRPVPSWEEELQEASFHKANLPYWHLTHFHDFVQAYLTCSWEGKEEGLKCR